MPEWITPLLRVLAPMPSRGICSTRNTSLQRRETARATAHPTTPPPMIKMFARSTADRILEGEGWRLAAGRNLRQKVPILPICFALDFGFKPAPEGVDISLA